MWFLWDIYDMQLDAVTIQYCATKKGQDYQIILFFPIIMHAASGFYARQQISYYMTILATSSLLALMISGFTRLTVYNIIVIGSGTFGAG